MNISFRPHPRWWSIDDDGDDEPTKPIRMPPLPRPPGPPPGGDAVAAARRLTEKAPTAHFSLRGAG